MRRYTLCKCCFAVLALLFLLIRTGDPPGPWDGCSGPVTAAGTVSRIEEKAKDNHQRQIILSLRSVTFCSGTFPHQNSDNLKTEPQKAAGILCYLAPGEEIPRCGESVIVSGQAEPFESCRNPGCFDAAAYYHARGNLFSLRETSIIKRSKSYDRYRQGLYLCRRYASAVLTEICGEDAGIMQAMLLGDKADLAKEVQKSYQNGGISHILAISGLHISFLGVGLYQGLKKILPLMVAGMTTAAVLISYVILTGGSPSAWRAGLMFLISLLAEASGRSYHRMTALSVSALISVLGQPLLLTQSGFLLSYGAILGLERIAPVLSGLWRGKAARLFLAGLSVSVVTLPVLLSSFYEFPLYSLLLNLLVIPLMGVVMVLGIAAFLAALVLPPLGRLMFRPVSILLAFFSACCSLAERMPGHMWRTGKPEPLQIIMYCVCLLVFCLVGRYMTKPLAVLLLVGGLWLLTGTVRIGDRMTVLDVGQGDSILLQSEGGCAVLIDGGSTSRQQLATYTLLPCLKSRGIKRLDYVFLTHMDADHISGVEQILEEMGTSREEVGIETLVLPAIGNPDQAYARIVSLAGAAGVRVCTMGDGDRLSVGGFSFLCLHPQKGGIYEDKNAASLVLYLQKDTFSVLLTGDLDGEAEELFAERIGQRADRRAQVYADLLPGHVTVLKAGHHGSAASCSEAFLSLTGPRITVISCGAENRYGHPDEDTLERLRRCGSHVFVTKDTGAVEILVQNGRVKVKTWLP